MRQAVTEKLSSESGQALTEAPIAIALVCMLIFVLIQPSLILCTRMCMNYSLAQGARVALTDTSEDSETFILSVIKDAMGVLPESNLFYVPGSLQLECTRDSDSNDVHLRLSLRQKMLPLLGGFFSSDSSGERYVEKELRVGGSRAGLDQAELEKSIRVGEGWNR